MIWRKHYLGHLVGVDIAPGGIENNKVNIYIGGWDTMQIDISELTTDRGEWEIFSEADEANYDKSKLLHSIKPSTRRLG
jgi:hypothetical protein